MACPKVSRRTGKGASVKVQPCVDNSTLACSGGFTLTNGVCIHDIDPVANPNERPICTPGTPMDLSVNGPWVSVGCPYEQQPPGYDFDSITGEMCLDEVGSPPFERGDEQEDNPGFIIPFLKGDAEFIKIMDWARDKACLAFWYQYPDGGSDYFFGKLKTNRPDNITRTDYMKTNVSILRTSEIYDFAFEVPTECGFDCVTCKECPCDPIVTSVSTSTVNTATLLGDWTVGICKTIRSGDRIEFMDQNGSVFASSFVATVTLNASDTDITFSPDISGGTVSSVRVWVR